MSWPVLQGQELAALKGAFASPLQLQAAFDGRDEAAELVKLKPLCRESAMRGSCKGLTSSWNGLGIRAIL